MNDKSANKLLSHPLTISVMEHFSPLLKPLEEKFIQEAEQSKETSMKSRKPQKDQSKLTLNLEQAYHAEVFQYVSNLIHAVERLDEIAIYLGQFPNSNTFYKQGITQDKWIHYHYANYTVTIVGIYDTILLLVNAIFMIGLNPRHCKDETVTNNLRVQLTPVAGFINKLNNIVQERRNQRHLYVHRGQLPDLGILETLESYRFIKEANEELGKQIEPIVHPVIVRDLYRLERRNLVKTARSDTTRITTAVVDIFNSLQPYYALYAKQFHS